MTSTAHRSPAFQARHAVPLLARAAAKAGAGLLTAALLLASTAAFTQAALSQAAPFQVVPSKAAALPAAQTATAPYTLPFAETFDMTAKSGRVYRIMVSRPFPGTAGTRPIPVVYVLDGNLSFAGATGTARLMSLGHDIPPVYVVGIGYPTDDWHAWFTLRSYDLTPTAGGVMASQALGGSKEKTGGSSEFLDFLTHQVMPAIQQRYPVDPKRSVLAGESLGGLFTAYALFHSPEAFSGYLVLSPSLWWDNGVAFDWEQANAKTGRPLQARVYLSAGAMEETPRDDASHDNLSRYGMVRNMKRLAAALSARPAGTLAVKSEVIENESHTSTFGAAFSRGIRFVLASPDSAATKAK